MGGPSLENNQEEQRNYNRLIYKEYFSKENELIKTITSIVHNILDNEKQLLDDSEVKDIFYEQLYSLFSLNLLKDNFIDEQGILGRYIQSDDNIRTINEEDLVHKTKKHFKTYKNILIANIQKELETIKEYSNINKYTIKEAIRKVNRNCLQLIFIFSEKVPIQHFEQELNISRSSNGKKNLGAMFNETRDNLQAIFEAEKVNNNELGKIYNEDFLEKWNIPKEKTHIFDTIYTRHYRNTLRSALKHSEVNTEKHIEAEAIQEKAQNILEENTYNNFENFLNIFEIWFETEGKDNSNLHYIEMHIRKLFNSIKIYRDTGIAFTSEKFSGNSDQEILQSLKKELRARIDITTDFYNYFFQLLDYSIQESSENKYKNFESKITDYKNIRRTSKLVEFSPEKEQEVLNKLKDSSNYIEEIPLDEWQELSAKEKYYYLQASVFSDGTGKFKLGDALKIEQVRNPKFFDIFFSSINVKGCSKEQLKKQLLEIENIANTDITIENFLEQDTNHFNILILWWRFILKVNQNGNATTVAKIEEKSYGLSEEISIKLSEKGLLNTDKVELQVSGKIRNSSANTVFYQTTAIFNNVKKNHIDIKNYSIKSLEKQIYLKNQKKIFIPRQEFEKKYSSDTDTSAPLKKWLDIGMDTCTSILQNTPLATTEHEIYKEIVSKLLNVSPKKDFTLQQKEEIQAIMEFLKYLYNQIEPLKNRFLTSEYDKKNIQSILKGKGTEIAESPSEIDTNSGKRGVLGPPKSFSRAFEKVVQQYNGDFTFLQDLTRLRITSNSIDEQIDDVVNFIENIHDNDCVSHIAIIDKTGEPLALPKLDSGYRDIKVMINMKNPETNEDSGAIEVQFLTKNMEHMKENGISFTSEDWDKATTKMKSEDKLLTKDDVDSYLELCKHSGRKIMKKSALIQLCDEDAKNFIEKLNFSNKYLDSLSSDDCYNITRSIQKQSLSNPLVVKMTRLERILYDIAWSKDTPRYLSERGLFKS